MFIFFALLNHTYCYKCNPNLITHTKTTESTSNKFYNNHQYHVHMTSHSIFHICSLSILMFCSRIVSVSLLRVHFFPCTTHSMTTITNNNTTTTSTTTQYNNNSNYNNTLNLSVHPVKWMREVQNPLSLARSSLMSSLIHLIEQFSDVHSEVSTQFHASLSTHMFNLTVDFFKQELCVGTPRCFLHEMLCTGAMESALAKHPSKKKVYIINRCSHQIVFLTFKFRILPRCA